MSSRGSAKTPSSGAATTKSKASVKSKFNKSQQSFNDGKSPLKNNKGGKASARLASVDEELAKEPAYHRYKKGWDKPAWKMEIILSKKNTLLAKSKSASTPLRYRRNSADSWLEEQSMLTDSDFKEAVDIDIEDVKYLNNMIKET